jgi:hypothetical protein
MRKFRTLLAPLALAMTLLPATAHAQDPTPAAPAPCPAFDMHQGTGPDAACVAIPHFKASFINRVWTFDGLVDDVDLAGHTLDMTTQNIQDLPTRFASQDDAIVNQDTRVKFASTTRVYDPEGHRVSQDYLDYAEGVSVAGKLMAPAHWATDAEGTAVPTIRAKRIYINDYVNDATDVQDDAAAADEGDVRATDPTPGNGVTSADVAVWISIYVHVHLH